MNYNQARYDVFWGYGPVTLDQWLATPDAPQSVVMQALEGLKSVASMRAIFLSAASRARASRRAKFQSSAGVGAALKLVDDDCQECGVYVFDADFTEIEAPDFLINFHASRSGMIAGRALEIPLPGEMASTFFLFGVSTELSQAVGFGAFALGASKALRLHYAYQFLNVGYEYDGKTPLEWAYKNHSARLRSGKLEELGSIRGGEKIPVQTSGNQ